MDIEKRLSAIKAKKVGRAVAAAAAHGAELRAEVERQRLWVGITEQWRQRYAVIASAVDAINKKHLAEGGTQLHVAFLEDSSDHSLGAQVEPHQRFFRLPTLLYSVDNDGVVHARISEGEKLDLEPFAVGTATEDQLLEPLMRYVERVELEGD
jgi:hypothetical protein